MTAIEQRFLESVPARLTSIERQLERMNDNLDRLIEVITKIWIRQ